MRTAIALAIVLLAAVSVLAPETEKSNLWRARMPEREVHPCLMFGPEDIPAIKERLKREPYQSWWRGVQASNSMVSQAFTWLMTGDVEKAEAVRKRLLRCNPVGYHCSCGVAEALQGVAEAYDLLYNYPGLTPQEHRVIRAKLAASCERYYLSALESGAGQHPGNQRTRGLCALGTAAIVLKGYDDAAHTPREWLQRALDGISQEANLQFWRDDGMFIEGPGYSSFTLSVMLPFARYYERASGKWLFDDMRLRNALQYLVYVTQPDGVSNAAGTTNMCNVVNSLRLCIGAGDPDDQAFYRWALAQWGSLSGGGVRDLALFDDSVKPEVRGTPTARFLHTSEEASIRREWSSNAVALWFRGKDSWLAKGYKVYSHCDTASFILHAYGELLAVDAGYDHWVSYDLYPPELHNTLLVDGKGPAHETAGQLRSDIDAGFLQAGDVTTSYEGIDLRRTFLMVDGQYVVIADDIQSPEEHEYQWQVHTPVSRETGKATIDGNRASWTGFDPRSDSPGKVAVQTVWAGPVTVEPMAKSRWQPWSSNPKTGSYDNWALVAKQRASDACYLTVLYPHPLAVAPPDIECPEVDGGRALVVTTGSTRDTLLVSEGGAVRCGDIETNVSTCAVRQVDGQPRWAYLNGSGFVRCGGKLLVQFAADGSGVVAVQMREGALSVPQRIHLVAPPGARLVLPRLSVDTAVFLCTRAGARARLQLTTQGDTSALTLADSPTGDDVLIISGQGQPPVIDGTSPDIDSLSVDGRDLPDEEIADLGRVETPPRAVVVQFSDTVPGLDAASVRATLNGVRLAGGVEMGADGRAAVALPDVAEQRDHELVVGVTDGAAFPNRRQFLLKFSLRPLLLNGGFEEGGTNPTGWSLGAWSSGDTTKFESRAVTDKPHSGTRCLMMKGIAAPLNMTAAQTVPLKVGSTYVLTGYYRGEVAAKASFCSQSGKGQYVWMPAVGPSEKWIPFRWEFTVENTEQRLLVALRLGAVGAAYFDDVALEEVR